MKSVAYKILLCLLLIARCCYAFENEVEDEPWLSYWEAANKYSEEKNFPKAIECYSSAIEIIEKADSDSPLFAYNERGMAYFRNGNFEKAIFDFNKVIKSYLQNPISSNLSQAVNALWSHLGICSHLNLRKQASKDFEKIIELDPHFPKVKHKGNILIISNLDFSESEETKEIFSSVMIKLGVCENKQDLTYYSSGVCVIKLSEKFQASLAMYDPRCKTCKPNNRRNLPSATAAHVNPRKLIECKKWCDDVSYSAGLGCAWCKTPIGKAACAAALYSIKTGCHWCCSEGSFYQKCIRPLQAFNPRDPAWDDDNEYSLPERDLNDKDIIWDDKDLVYSWDDI
jgi:tetratricopeptide (TPR) repeat protein